MRDWREEAQRLGPVAPEAEPLAGDLGMLVPLAPGWRVLDLSGGDGWVSLPRYPATGAEGSA